MTMPVETKKNLIENVGSIFFINISLSTLNVTMDNKQVCQQSDFLLILHKDYAIKRLFMPCKKFSIHRKHSKHTMRSVKKLDLT